MEIIEVNDKKTQKEFLDVARVLYKDDPFWVCPLDIELNAKFDPKQNLSFQHGEAKRWVLKSDKKLIGRIAAFYFNEELSQEKMPVGGMGFFESINDQKAAFLLFDTAKDWLKSKGLQAMDGPVNFGENNNDWGLLVDGFVHPGYGMPYNHSYYKDLFEAYGFRIYFEQFSYHLDIKKKFNERFWKVAEWIANKPDYSFKHFRFKEKDRFIQDMVTIYNAAWPKFKKNFKPLDPQVLQDMLQKAKNIIDEQLVWFAYNKNEPIAFFIMFPDVNQILKYLNGKLTFWNIIKFMYLKKKKTITRIRAIVAGITPKFQNSGIDAAIFKQYDRVLLHQKSHLHYNEIELSWVGDFNPKMRAMYEAVGGKLAKKHITYRYLFDPKAEFVRFMPEEIGKFEYIGKH